PRSQPGAWQIVQRIDVPEISGALRQIEEDMAGGAGAVELVFAGSALARGAGLSPARPAELEQLAALLRQNAVAARVEAGEDTPALTAGLLRRMTTGGNAPRLIASFDPIA